MCGSKKSQFLREDKGLFNNALGNLGFEMHLPASKGEEVPNGSFSNLKQYSYCGPGTKYEQRNREGYKVLMNWTKCVNCTINFIMKMLTRLVGI